MFDRASRPPGLAGVVLGGGSRCRQRRPCGPRGAPGACFVGLAGRGKAKNRTRGVRPAPSALLLEDGGVPRGSPSVHEPRGPYVASGSGQVLRPGR